MTPKSPCKIQASVFIVQGFGIATELKEGSVMDILSKTNLPATSVFKSVNELKNDNIVDHSPVLGTKSAEKSKSDKNDGVSGMFKPAATLKTGSVMDILGKPSDADKKTEQLKEGSVMDAMSKGLCKCKNILTLVNSFDVSSVNHLTTADELSRPTSCKLIDRLPKTLLLLSYISCLFGHMTNKKN